MLLNMKAINSIFIAIGLFSFIYALSGFATT